MSKDFRLPSLAQHFDPPKGFVGHFGWMVGFSADASFMNDAAERFTGQTKAQRASQGRIALALFLDPHNPPILLTDAPGVVHLPFSDLKNKPCRLVHAKVALLGFQHLEQREKWCIRLLVSTGNWTRQTLEESLDLAWRVDVYSDKLSGASGETQQACADIGAANNLMDWLRKGAGGMFDVRLLKSKQTEQDQKEVDDWIIKCVRKATGSPRFSDNRQKSLLAQLPKLVKCTGQIGTRGNNYLALGSGFYEGGAEQGSVPTVPQAIIKNLRDARLLTSDTDIDLFVNSQACQSVAASVEIKQPKTRKEKTTAKLKGTNIIIRPAIAPQWMQDKNSVRTLHAKFLFSAHSQDNSSQCNRAWVYLGSGNLTNPGFAQKMSANGGNLEAGVVFGVSGLQWKGGRRIKPEHVVTNLLPIQWDTSFENGEGLSAGDAWEREQPSHFAPPVAWLVWHEGDGSAELHLPDDASDTPPFVILNDAEKVQRNGKAYPWTGPQPQQVRWCWQDGDESRKGIIPVMDAFGRIAAVKLSPIENMNEAWLQLADFPNPPEVDEPDEMDGGADEGGNVNSSSSANGGSTASYPIRQMMKLVENIAAKQTEISEYDWPLWCRRLEQTLTLAKGNKVVEYFVKDLQLNPLAPLRHPPFRPDYAEDSSSKTGKKYENVLKEIEKSWGVNKLAGLGGGNV